MARQHTLNVQQVCVQFIPQPILVKISTDSCRDVHNRVSRLLK